MNHSEPRLCVLEGCTETEKRFSPIVAVCSCGQRKEYFATEADSYIFVCNGSVILKYREESADTFGLNQSTPVGI